MAYQSPVFQQKGRLYYQPTQGSDFSYIQDPNQLSSLAKQGALKAGAPRQTLPTNARIAGQPAKPLAEPPTQSGMPSGQPKPQIGSQTAFNLVFGQLMGHATKLQGLQDQKNKLLLQLYDRQLTPEELRTLSPSQQQAIREGNKNLLEYQVMSLNDIIKGRSDQNTQALQYMMEGYQMDQQELERKKTTAYNTTLALINKFGDLSGLSQESRDAVSRGEMPTQEDLIKLGRTLKEQELATKKSTQVVEVGKKKMLVDMQTGKVIKDLGTAPSAKDEESLSKEEKAFFSDIDKMNDDLATGKKDWAQAFNTMKLKYGAPDKLLDTLMNKEIWFTKGAYEEKLRSKREAEKGY